MKRTFAVPLVILSFIAFAFMVAPCFAAETIRTPGSSYWVEFYGSRLLEPLDKTTVLTDAEPTIEYTVNTLYITDIVVDLTVNKGTTLVITPLLDVDVLATAGPPSTTLTIPDLGGVGRAIYSKISAPYAKVTVTKTEAGSSTALFLSIRGIQ